MSGKLRFSGYEKVKQHWLSESHDHSSVQQDVAADHAKPQKTPQRIRVDWRIPTLMGISLLAGIAIALIHHFFYWYWNGKPVQNDTQQKWVTRAGTAFAFCFRASVAAGTGMAFVQQMWLCLRARPYRVGHINSMFTILTSAPQFLNFKLWYQVPLLVLMALITWSLPFAAVIAPGTLIVTSELHTSSVLRVVPQFDFKNNPQAFGDYQNFTQEFWGPTSALARTSLSSAVSGSILSIAAPEPNSSYTLSFNAPALSCTNGASNATKDLFPADSFTGYYSWVPQPGLLTIANPPVNETNDGSETFQPLDSTVGVNRGAMLFVFAIGNGYDLSGEGLFVSCMLNNASYEVDFIFQDSQQSLSIKKQEGRGVPAHAEVDPDQITEAEFVQKVPYLSVMSAFGRIMTGTVPNGGTSAAEAPTDMPDSTLVQSTPIGDLLWSSDGSLLYSADFAMLSNAIEEMFVNITLSLLSASEFTVDPQSTTVPPTNVTVHSPRNIYNYQPLDLALAYGLALLAAGMCISIGYLAMIRNGLSYSNDFSTILRSTRNNDLDDLISTEEAHGADPVPNHVANATLTYRPFSSDGWPGFRRH